MTHINNDKAIYSYKGSENAGKCLYNDPKNT